MTGRAGTVLHYLSTKRVVEGVICSDSLGDELISSKVLTNLAGGRARSLMIRPYMEGPMSARR